MEQIQKQKSRRREAPQDYDPLPDPVDESELLDKTEHLLGKIAVELAEKE